jgi:streptogramin lyase
VSESGTLVATSKKTSMSLTLTGTLASGDISIYWANAARGAIGRADLDGSNVNESFISSGSEPVAVAVDHHHIYWVDQDNGTIGRANLDGTNVNQSFIAPSGTRG